MERMKRKPLQGVLNIVRFNWHYYVIAVVLIAVLLLLSDFLPGSLKAASVVIGFLAFAGMLISLAASHYVYDRSGLYSLDWLNSLGIGKDKKLVNINAGFDETSSLLAAKYPGAELAV